MYLSDNVRGVPAALVDKLRKMLGFIDAMENVDELQALASWKPHSLSGNRKGTISLSVTGNLRLTFKIDVGRKEILEVDLEDYH